MLATKDTTTTDTLKVTAVVVTFNRKDLLLECIDSLYQQTHPVSSVIVVDNSSSDGTKEALDSLRAKYPNFIYERLDTNTGGAGGFAHGINVAIEKTNCDWIWVMDDDVEAYPDGLEGLLKFSDQSECIHGRRSNPDGTPYYWQSWFNPKLGFSFPKADTAFAQGEDSVEVNVACFEGMLISRNIVNKIGPPDKRFFIAWDDTTYGYLASKHTNLLYVNHFSLKRKRSLKALQLGIRTLNETSDMYRFYHIRNRALLKRYLLELGEYNPLLFNLMTLLLIIKEELRAIALKGNFKAYKSLLKGYSAQESLAEAEILLPVGFYLKAPHKITEFSVLMSLYEKENPQFLDSCLESCFLQTLKATEIVMVLDGPIGAQLKEIINKWQNSLPIKLIPLKTNRGLGEALNEGLKHCSHEIVLRMDTDDICLPERFELQIKFLNNHPDVDILSGKIEEVDPESLKVLGYKSPPLSHHEIKNYIRYRNPINHMAVAFKKNKIISAGGYIHCLGMEDYHLWIRAMAKGLKFANKNRILVRARTGNQFLLRRRGLAYLKSEFQIFLLICRTLKKPRAIAFVIFLGRALSRILPANLLTMVYGRLRKKPVALKSNITVF